MPEESGGRYVGRLLLSPLSDGRLMRLEEEFGFIDYRNRDWPVPIGVEVDGASIPRLLWSLAGSPFTGKYRDASVIHDFYCDIRSRTWPEVHRVFYDGMIASGVGVIQAKLFYGAVFFAGPRWPDTVKNNINIALGVEPESYTQNSGFGKAAKEAVSFRSASSNSHDIKLESTEVNHVAVLNLDKLREAIEAYNPSVEEITKALDASRGDAASGTTAAELVGSQGILEPD